MRRYRVSVAALMIGILVVALCFAALHAGTVGWSNAISGLVMFTLAVATSSALFTRGDARAFWGGMAVFGWQFLVVQMHENSFLFFLPVVVEIAGEIASAFYPLAESPTADSGYVGFNSVRKVYLIDAGGKWAQTQVIALGLLNLIYAFTGGLITLGMARLSERRKRERGRKGPDEARRSRS